MIPFLFLFSCVSSKKYRVLDASYKASQSNEKNCNELLLNSQALNNDLTNQRKALQAQIDYLNSNNANILGALKDMSVLTSKQAESVKQSLQNLSEKDAYIMNLQTAISRKDSLNMNLVMNLKSSLANINDEDVNIKVEKGVVYVDISDKLLFNSGKYDVTERAQEVLGKVARVLNAYPDIEFMVEGHTDSVPIHTECMEDNWDLSVKRATAIVRILENKYQMSPSRMTASGHSEYAPVASNETKEGRALNRRTRIIILPQLDQFFKLMLKQ